MTTRKTCNKTKQKLSCSCNIRSYRVRRYDVRYTGKLSNRFRLQVYKRLVRTIRFNW